MKLPSPRPLLKSLARRPLFSAFEALWAALFTLARVIVRPRPRRWSSPGGERVLVIAPHPDDETLGCGGTISLHLGAGDTVTVAIVTDGGGSRAGALSPERIITLRRQETQHAISLLGSPHLLQMGLPEGRWLHEELVERLSQLLSEARPTIIYCTSCVDFHPEHLRVAQALAGTLSSSPDGSCNHVRAYEVQVPLTPILTNLVAPVRSVDNAKSKALRAYSTQLPALHWSPRLARYNGSFYGCDGPAEVFWEISPSAYARLHLTHLDPATYRGLRPRPFTDPLAWLVGLQHRRKLRALSDK